MVRVRVFETSTLDDDAITAIVYSNGYPVNVIVDKYYPFPRGKAFVLDAMRGFPKAIPYCKETVSEKAKEIEKSQEVPFWDRKMHLICDITDNGKIVLYRDAMSCAGGEIFGCPDDCSGSCAKDRHVRRELNEFSVEYAHSLTSI